MIVFKGVYLKPIFSILIITGTCLLIAFLTMEERRMGYNILKLTRIQKQVLEEKRIKSIELAKLRRPQNIESLAQKKMLLKRVQSDQIIHITGAESVMTASAAVEAENKKINLNSLRQ